MPLTRIPAPTRSHSRAGEPVTLNAPVPASEKTLADEANAPAEDEADDDSEARAEESASSTSPAVRKVTKPA